MKRQLSNYYLMLDSGIFTHEPNRPKGFGDFGQEFKSGSNIPAGVIVSRNWRSLKKLNPQWRNELNKNYSSKKVLDALTDERLKPIVFSDVDYAVMDRDAQQHVDQYIADRATLESLGFIAQFYQDLRNPNIRLDEIKRFPSVEKSFGLGQELLHRALKTVPNNFIKPGFEQQFEMLLEKGQNDLTDKDYKVSLTIIHDSFYKLIVDPLSDYFNREFQDPLQDIDMTDPQARDGRMDLIYTTIAAFSHVSIADRYRMVKHESYGQFDARTHLYPGIPEFFEYLRENNIESVGITRGNQVPYIRGSGSHLDNLFDRVHATLISHNRSREDLDTLYPKKRVRPYSQINDNLSSEDKIRIIFHEALEKFRRARLRFDNPDELLAGVATYLDRCIFITDSDIEVWNTCPIVGVVALRTPDETRVSKYFDSAPGEIEPIVMVNPQAMEGPNHGHAPEAILTNFYPKTPAVSQMLDNLKNSRSFKETPSLSRSL